MEASEEPQPTSRLCIKGIPKYVMDTRLREHFSAKGEVTDCKIMRTRDGRSRQMAFVGFKTADDAAKAHKYFNNSFMDTARLVVEFARKVGDDTLPRPWSKYSKGSTANKRLQTVEDGDEAAGQADAAGKKVKKRKVAKKPEEEDPKLAEFLALMQPRSKAKVWSNDVLVQDDLVKPQQQQAGGGGGKRGRQGGEGSSGEEEEEEEDELYQDLPGTRGEAGESEEEGEEGEEGGARKERVVVDQAVSDLEYMRSRMRKALVDDDEQASEGDKGDGDSGDGDGDDDEEDEEGAREGEEEGSEHGAEKEGEEGATAAPHETGGQEGDGGDAGARGDQRGVGPSHEEDGAQYESGRLFVRNLPYTTSEAELAELFAEYGDVVEVHLVLDKQTRKSTGIAFVRFMMPEDAVRAAQSLDGSIFQGRLLHILPARQAPGAGSGLAAEARAEEDTKDGFKREREKERKGDAGQRAAWSTLFMRPDTVAEAVAAHYGLDKSTLLDRDAPDLAVRMALGEAHVIAKTKESLAEAGVDVSKLEAAAAASGKASAVKSVARSGSVLLVKNLPYTSTEEDLSELFCSVGPVSRLVLPATHTVALVEYAEPADARNAFRRLAYKRFQHVPLYLEWAPKGIFTTAAPPPPPAAVAAVAVAGKDGKVAEAPPSKAAVLEGEEEGEGAALCTLYVRNLAFATTPKALQKHFNRAVLAAGGQLRSARIATRAGPDGKPLSMGFGFVECDVEAVARAVLKQMQGSTLDGHKLALQLSKQRAGGKEATAGAGNAKPAAPEEEAGTKLVVRNVAFEATKRDLKGLFTPFGTIKTLRLPKKFDGSHRGFAFVEFVTKQESRNAMDSVTGTHLYGRRLLVEYAKEEEGLDELRAKTATKFRGDEEAAEGGAKRKRKMARL